MSTTTEIQAKSAEVALAGLLDVRSASQSAAHVSGVEFFVDGEYKSYAELGDSPLKQEHLQQVAITHNGETQYYHRIHEESRGGAKDAQRADVSYKEVAWVRTDENGNLPEGNPHVIRAFPGYEGNPVEAGGKVANLSALASHTADPNSTLPFDIGDPAKMSAETRDMYAVGDDRLYPPTTQIAASTQELSGITSYKNNKGEDVALDMSRAEYSFVGHSLGSNNALVAAVEANLRGQEVESSYHLEPVGVSGTLSQLQQIAKGENLTPDQQALREQLLSIPGATPEKLEASIAETVQQTEYSRVVVDGKFSKSAHLGSVSESVSSDELRQNNLAAMYRDAPAGLPQDPDNQGVGTGYVITSDTGMSVARTSLATKLDPSHNCANACETAKSDSAHIISFAEYKQQMENGKEAERQFAEPKAEQGKEGASTAKPELNFDVLIKELATGMGQVGKGDVGSLVAGVQQSLGVTVDGKFGDETLAAVRNFQKEAGITVDGLVGKETLQALVEKTGFDPSNTEMKQQFAGLDTVREMAIGALASLNVSGGAEASHAAVQQTPGQQRDAASINL